MYPRIPKQVITELTNARLPSKSDHQEIPKIRKRAMLNDRKARPVLMRARSVLPSAQAVRILERTVRVPAQAVRFWEY